MKSLIIKCYLGSCYQLSGNFWASTKSCLMMTQRCTHTQEHKLGTNWDTQSLIKCLTFKLKSTVLCSLQPSTVHSSDNLVFLLHKLYYFIWKSWQLFTFPLWWFRWQPGDDCRQAEAQGPRVGRPPLLQVHQHRLQLSGHVHPQSQSVRSNSSPHGGTAGTRAGGTEALGLEKRNWNSL